MYDLRLALGVSSCPYILCDFVQITSLGLEFLSGKIMALYGAKLVIYLLNLLMILTLEDTQEGTAKHSHRTRHSQCLIPGPLGHQASRISGVGGTRLTESLWQASTSPLGPSGPEKQVI